MKEYDATEVAYKNGYEAGYADGEIDFAPKWIPVTERLPEPLEWVLCACKSNAVHILRHDHIFDNWDMQEVNRCYRKEFVTHWMPLPEPPKGE